MVCDPGVKEQLLGASYIRHPTEESDLDLLLPNTQPSHSSLVLRGILWATQGESYKVIQQDTC